MSTADLPRFRLCLTSSAVGWGWDVPIQVCGRGVVLSPTLPPRAFTAPGKDEVTSRCPYRIKIIIKKRQFVSALLRPSSRRERGDVVLIFFSVQVAQACSLL